MKSTLPNRKYIYKWWIFQPANPHQIKHPQFSDFDPGMSVLWTNIQNIQPVSNQHRNLTKFRTSISISLSINKIPPDVEHASLFQVYTIWTTKYPTIFFAKKISANLKFTNSSFKTLIVFTSWTDRCLALVIHQTMISFIGSDLSEKSEPRVGNPYYFPLNPGWLIRILIMVYYNPYIIGYSIMPYST